MSIIMPLGPFARTKANKLGARPVFVRQQQRIKLVCMRLFTYRVHFWDSLWVSAKLPDWQPIIVHLVHILLDRM
jgi:hypothetical protein